MIMVFYEYKNINKNNVIGVVGVIKFKWEFMIVKE